MGGQELPATLQAEFSEVKFYPPPLSSRTSNYGWEVVLSKKDRQNK